MFTCRKYLDIHKNTANNNILIKFSSLNVIRRNRSIVVGSFETRDDNGT